MLLVVADGVEASFGELLPFVYPLISYGKCGV